MKVFCSRCGTPREVEDGAASAVLLCGSCGAQFSLRAPAVVGPAKSSSPLLLILVAVAAVPCIIGVLAAIAIPNFIRFQARAKQGECKTNLKAAFTAERAYFAEKDEYSSSLQRVGFEPERGNRYAYFLSLEGTMEDRVGPTTKSSPSDVAVGVDLMRYRDVTPIGFGQARSALRSLKVGSTGECPKCEFTALCVGNIDRDDTLDVWSISTLARVGSKGEPIPAGTPYNDISDLTE